LTFKKHLTDRNCLGPRSLDQMLLMQMR